MTGNRHQPIVASIVTNAVRAVQREHDEEQLFSTEIQEANKLIRLANVPVISCELWVDEASAILKAEVDDIRFRHPELIQITEEHDTITSCRILWHQTASLSMCGPDERAYELDPFTGEIRFGNGICGKIPPAGVENISAYVTYGGGRRGNADKGMIDSFLISVPRISGLSNVTRMTGGTDRVPHERIEQYGNKRLRHRGRAVSARDYEELVAENFSIVEQVKCFRNTDEEGKRRAGSVCVVVRPSGNGNDDMSWKLCREIKEFLSKRCDCCVAESGRLHVRPSLEMTINADITVEMQDLSKAVRTQRELKEVIQNIIEEKWAKREIGDQIRITDIYADVSRIANVAGIRQLLLEGSYYKDGKHYIVPIEDDSVFEFATVVNGTHKVRIG